MSIKFKIISVVIILIFLIVILNFWIFNQSNNLIEKNIQQKTIVSAENLSSKIEGFITSQHNIIKVLSQNELSKKVDSSFLIGSMNERKNDYSNFLILYISNLDGNYITTQNKRKNIADRTYFKRAVEQDQDVVERVLSKTTSKYVLVVGSPVKENSKIVGFIGGTIELSLISNFLNEDNGQQNILGKDSYTYIIDSEGTIISHPNNDFIIDEQGDNENFIKLGDNNFKKMHEDMKNGNRGIATHKYDGVKRTTAYIPIKIDDYTTWSLAVSTNLEELNKEYTNLNYQYYFGVLVITIIFLILLSIIISLILKPSQKVIHYLNEISTGNLNIKIQKPQSNDEFRKILDQLDITAKSLDKMIKNINNEAIKVYSVATESKEKIELLKQNISNISISTEQLSSSMEEAAASSEEINAISYEIQKFSSKIASKAKEGVSNTTKMQNTYDNIRQLMGLINNSINNVNLLEKKDSILNVINQLDSELQTTSDYFYKFTTDLNKSAESMYVSINNSVKGISELGETNNYSAIEIVSIAKNSSYILNQSNQVLELSEKSRKSSFALMESIKKFVI